MSDKEKAVKEAIEYAKRIEGTEWLSPNDLRLIALAEEVLRLRVLVPVSKRKPS